MQHITVYTKPGCPPCRATLRALRRAGLDYEMVDITTDAEAPRLRDEPGRTTGPGRGRRRPALERASPRPHRRPGPRYRLNMFALNINHPHVTSMTTHPSRETALGQLDQFLDATDHRPRVVAATWTHASYEILGATGKSGHRSCHYR